MSDTAILLNAFRAGDFEEAKHLLINDKDLATQLHDHQYTTVFDQIIIGKAFDLIPVFLTQELISTDLYDYKSFNGTIFQSIITHLKDDDESLAFLTDFLSGIENINDEIQGETLLDYAMERSAALSLIKILVEAGCDLNQLNNAEYNYLHRVVRNNRIKADQALSYLEFLIQEGLDVNAVDVTNQTPLIHAITGNKPELADLLLQHGAEVNHQDNTGNSAFFYTIVHQRKLELYMKLKKYETPELNHLNKDRTTILFEFIRSLQKPTATELKFMAQLIEDGADPIQPSIWYDKEKMPLDVAVEKSFELFKALVQTQIDVNAVYTDGNSLLHKVCAFNVNYDSDQARDTYKKVKLLLEMGVDVNLSNNKDETALSLASDDNLKSKTVELLLTYQKS